MAETPGLELKPAVGGRWQGRFRLLDAAPVGQLNGNVGGGVTSGPVDFTVDGLAPHSLLIVAIRSKPYPLVLGEADENGRFTARMIIDPMQIPRARTSFGPVLCLATAWQRCGSSRSRSAGRSPTGTGVLGCLG